jgi:hypothetical protein
MAASQHEEFGETLKARGKLSETDPRDGNYAIDELSKFSNWLGSRDSEPYTAIVDGPNIGYFGHGDVHYSQVKLVVEQLESMGEKVLVTMPQKYAAPSFWLPGLGYNQVLSPDELGIMNNLITSDKMYIVPLMTSMITTGCSQVSQIKQIHDCMFQRTMRRSVSWAPTSTQQRMT